MKPKILIIYCLFSLFLSNCTPSDPNNETFARVMVWQFVESKLKDPGSAEFGSCRMKKTNSGAWETNSYVDAKNGFGGTQRLKFYCKVNYKSGDTWELIELKFE